MPGPAPSDRPRPEMLLREAIRRHQAGDFAGAIDLYTRLLTGNWQRTTVLNNLAAALRAAGRPVEAETRFREALAASGDDPWIRLNLASLLFAENRLDEAFEALAGAWLAAPQPKLTTEFVTRLAGPLPDEPGPLFREALERLAEDRSVPPHRLFPALGVLLEQSAEPVAALTSKAAAILLSDGVVADDRVEQHCARFRAQWLAAVLAGEEPGEPARQALAVVALQAQAGEWVWAESAAERAGVDRLAAQLAGPRQRIADNGAPGAALLVLACYRPLTAFAGDPTLLAAAEADGSAAELLRRHLIEPAEQSRCAAALPVLTEVADPVSERVRDQYEQRPYPRWRRLPERPPVDIGSALAAALGDPALVRAIRMTAPEILVAGCGTGRHACLTATRFRNARVLAVDLSATSLGYAAARAAALGLENITFARGDLLGLGSLARRFDSVEASGVLHHLADPETGWRILRGLVRPGGLMRIGLYSQRGRAGLDQARVVIREAGLAASEDGLRSARARLRGLPATAPARAFCRTGDFFSLSGCRDMLFPAHEDPFTLPRIAAALTALDLEFLGFELPDPRARQLYRRRFPGDPPAGELAHWERFEADHPDLFAAMYQFWCRARP